MKVVNPYELRVLFFEITQKCNAHCDHCGSRCDIGSMEGISKELWMEVLDDVKKNLGTNAMLNITGGEPLMRKDLFEITSYADKLGFDWGMVTNGVLINENVISKMKKAGMKTISISLDGMALTHESFRHLPKGSFNRIIQNIIILQDADFLEHIQVTFIANKKNINELPALYRMLDNLKIDSLRISSIDPIGRACERNDLMLDKKDFEYLMDFIKTHQSLPCVWSCSHYFGNTDKPDDMGRIFTCNTGKHVGSILANGDIFVCPNVPRLPNLIQGNIKNGDKFSDVWKNKFEFFRNKPLNENCHNCKFVEHCKGDSLHTWDFEENKPTFCYKEMLCSSSKDEKAFKSYQEYLKANNIEVEVLKNNYDGMVAIIEPSALNDINSYFHSGESNPMSMYEQMMGLVGFKEGNNIIIRYAFPVPMKKRTRNMGYVDKDTFDYVQDELAIIKENLKLSSDRDKYVGEIKFLGFIHSHPLDVDFKYSQGDISLQQKMAKRDKDSIGLLINPQKGALMALYGENCSAIKIALWEKIQN